MAISTETTPLKLRLRGPSTMEVNMYGYGPPPLNPREWVEAMQDWEEWQEEKEKKRKDRDKSKQPKGLSTGQTFLVLTWSSVIVGPLYWYIVISMVHRIGEVFGGNIPH